MSGKNLSFLNAADQFLLKIIGVDGQVLAILPDATLVPTGPVVNVSA